MDYLHLLLSAIDLICAMIVTVYVLLDFGVWGGRANRWHARLRLIFWPALIAYAMSGVAALLLLDEGGDLWLRALSLVVLAVSRIAGGPFGDDDGDDDDDPDGDDDDDDPTGRRVEPESSAVERIGDRLRVTVPAMAGA